MIYFDNSATSLIKPKEVKESVVNALINYTANPGRSGHLKSIKTAEKIYQTREKVKKFFNCEDFSLIFTKNCTEALNLAILGYLKQGDHVIVSCYEHNSVLRPLKYLENLGVEITILICDLKEFDLALKSKIKPNTKMVITTYVSNVTGDVCNIKKVGAICKEYGIVYLVDGAQACGHIKIDLKENFVDMFAFAGHKGLLSITGVGGLIVKDISTINPLMFGGTGIESENLIQPKIMEEDFEAGTIPSVAIISLGAGIDFLNKNLELIIKKEEKLSKYLYKSLQKLKFLEIYSNETALNVFSFNIKNLDSNEVANILNEKYSIAVRSGLHCAPLIHKKLKTEKLGAVRVSIDYNNEFYEIDTLIKALNEIFNSGI